LRYRDKKVCLLRVGELKGSSSVCGAYLKRMWSVYEAYVN